MRWTELAGSLSPGFGEGSRLSATGRPVSMAGVRVTRARGVVVHLDDRPLPGGLNALEELNMDEFHRVETFGYRGERGLRFYTLEYLWRLAEADLRPGLLVAPVDRFRPTAPGFQGSRGGGGSPDRPDP